jgi:hypothetical protein
MRLRLSTMNRSPTFSVETAGLMKAILEVIDLSGAADPRPDRGPQCGGP